MELVHQPLLFDDPDAASQSQPIDVAKYASVAVTVIGTGFTGTLQIQAKGEDGVWYNVRKQPLSGDGALTTTDNDISLTTDSTRRRYLIVEPVEIISVNKSVQSAGTLAQVYVSAKEAAVPAVAT